jgi:hypothetical protein
MLFLLRSGDFSEDGPLPMTSNRLLLGMLVSCLLVLDVPAVAEEFRIDSMVFRDGHQDAICRNTTLLIGDKSYDQLHAAQPEVTIVDVSASQVTILDPSRQRRTQLGFDELANFVHTASARAANSRAYVRFAAQPEFKTSFAAEKRLLELTGDQMRYRVETMAAPSSAAAAQFRTFADWTARLNTVRPGLPPAARLALNQQLFAHRHLPTVISRAVMIEPDSYQRLTSRHAYTWTLSAEDRQAAARFDDWVNRFERVDLHTMLNPAE